MPSINKIAQRGGKPFKLPFGFEIYLSLYKPKRYGRERVEINLRQTKNGKTWRLEKSLNYPHGTDLFYFKDEE